MKPRSRTMTMALLAAGVLATVAVSYFDPHVMVDLANQLWACF
jgi:hypothetical protein